MVESCAHDPFVPIRSPRRIEEAEVQMTRGTLSADRLEFPAPRIAQIMRVRAVVFILCAVIAGCGSEQTPAKAPAQASTVKLVGIPLVMDPFANFYRERLPEIAFPLEQTDGMLANVDYLQRGLGDVTFTQSDIAYTALTKGTESNPTPHTTLRGLAVTWMVAQHLVVGPNVDFHSLNDLRGKRVGIGPLGGGTPTHPFPLATSH